MKGKKQWVHRANKSRSRNSDASKLDTIQIHLEQLHYHVFREPHISNGNFSTRNHMRNPDLKVEIGKFECYIELDGKIHGSLEQPTEKTIKRNIDYEVAHYNYIILSEEDAKFFKLDVADLAAYRINEEYSKHLAKVNGGCMFV